jgi:DNA gyrase subunit B
MTDPYEDVYRVQKRPGMYVGPTDDGTGLHNMVYEVVGNAINEALRGHATNIIVKLNSDGSCTVQDDGRGLPIDTHPKFGISAAEAIMTRLHGSFVPNDYLPNGYKGLHGVGNCVVNALSDWLDLRIWRDGKEHRIQFLSGKVDAPLAELCDAGARHGTQVTFLPAASFFSDVRFDRARLAQQLRELASQYAVSIEFVNAREE